MAELSQAERDRISDLGGFEGIASNWSWQRAKGVFEREGLADQWADALPALVDYDDPSEGAEEWVADARQSDHEQGTATASGGARDEGEAEAREARQAAEAARSAQANRCEHARDHCEHGDSDACEFLTSVCGLSDEQVEQILDGTEGDAEKGELPGEVYGALEKLWDQYRAGLGDAKRAAAGINEIRAGYGQAPLAFGQLGEREITREDLSS